MAAASQEVDFRNEKPTIGSSSNRWYSLLTRIDWSTVFGYDVFTSYKRNDASGFAAALAQELHERDYTCFIDKSDAPPGVPLGDHISNALARSRALLVIVTQGALDSPWVMEELRLFLDREQRPVLPIDVDRRFASLLPAATPWGKLREANPIWLDVSSVDVGSGQPAVSLINEIERLFRYTKANTLRRMTIFLIGLALLGAGCFATVKAIQENRARVAAEKSAANEREARKYADKQTKLVLNCIH